MPKRTVKVAIVVLWLAMMAWWWHESRTWPVPEKIEAAFLPDFNDYFSLKYGDRKIGWSFKSLRRLPNGDYIGNQGTALTVEVGGQRMDVRVDAIVNMDQVLDVRDFQYIFSAGPLRVLEKGVVDNGRLTVSVNLGEHGPVLESFLAEYGSLLGAYAERLDFSRDVESPVSAGPALGAFVGPFLGHIGLESGRNYSVNILDPINRRPAPVSVRVVERTREKDMESGLTVDIYQLLLGASGRESRLWVDRFGRTVRESGLGFTMTREESQAAASKDVEPFQPPKTFERFLSGGTGRNFLEKLNPADGETKP